MKWPYVLDQLESGRLRAANKDENGHWRPNLQVKEAILRAFREGRLAQMGDFVDKDTVAPQHFHPGRKVRLVPGGSAVRRGAFLAPSVVMMPPSYVNIGAYVGAGSMIDSHVLVGSCAQIGQGVHLSAGVQIGGVLEPVGLAPVVVEDQAFVGAQAVLVEGVCVGQGAVIAPGVILSQGTPVFDCVKERRLAKGEPIPPLAVLVPGSRPLSGWARKRGLCAACALIVKYRDANTDASLVLERVLR